ncbi:MAG: beta-lactamase family protein [Treponema sp.]|jgi:CubicO group peptidase (beta-lactamase class C family)|nr:beta-lactamase family protein [Treponema sp.]
MDITAYVDAVEGQKLDVEGVVVLQQGKPIGEYRWVPDVPRNVYSVSKSFTAIAVGMALDEGKLSLTHRVIDAFPGLVPKPSVRLKALTLEHLLTMGRGYPEFTRPRSVVEVLSESLAYDPGTRFVYDNASTFLASAMVTKAMGSTVRDLLVERLFRPLEIPDPQWAASDDGYTMGATGLEVSTKSLGVFGQFLLQRGVWKGRQLVSPGWIDGATRTHVATGGSHPDYDLGYGYFFWTCRHGAYRADGKNGQYVVVLPREDAVVAITSNEENMNAILYAVWDHILPQLW